MKKNRWAKLFLCLILIMSLVAVSTACGGGGSDSSSDEGDKVAKEITVRIGAGQTPEAYTWIRGMTEYLMPTVDEELAKTGNYKIKWVESWGGTVATVTESLEACQDGLLDVTNVCYVFEQSNLPYGNITYFVPFGVWDNDKAFEIQQDFIKKYDVIANEFDQFNQKAIGWATAENYNMTTKFKYTGQDSLKGMRAGAAGSNLSWITNDVTKIQSGGPDAYNALQTGMYEMALQPTSFHRDLSLYEVAPYGLIGDFGVVWMGAVTANTDFLEGLPQEVQDAFWKGGEAYTNGMLNIAKDAYTSSIEFLKENCKDVVFMTHEQKVEWAKTLDNVPLNYVETKEAEGVEGIRALMKDYLETIKNDGFEPVRDWASELPDK